jgi:hypothetical protein
MFLHRLHLTRSLVAGTKLSGKFVTVVRPKFLLGVHVWLQGEVHLCLRLILHVSYYLLCCLAQGMLTSL